MAASVLASAALVGLMGVLATAHLHPKWSSGGAAAMLVISAAYSLRSLWTLSRAGFEIRLESQALSTNKNQLLEDLTAAIAGHSMGWHPADFGFGRRWCKYLVKDVKQFGIG